MRIAVLLACFNRLALTMRCLESVRAGASGMAVDIYLLDDASTDGTAAKVRERFPETVVIDGHGGYYWNAGMHKAWERALSGNYDLYLLLNDDVALDPDFLNRIVAVLKETQRGGQAGIVVGSTRAAAGGRVTYGGYRKIPSAWRFQLKRILPADHPVACDTFNANCVLVPASAVARIGILDPVYFHSFGDIDYGLRAHKAGVPIWLCPGTIGVCETNEKKIRGGWGDPALPLRRRWEILRTPKGLDPRSWFRLARRHGGVLWPITAVMPYRYLLGFGVSGGSDSS